MIQNTKTAIRILIAILLAALLAGCSPASGPAHGTDAIESVETIRDAMELKDAAFEQSALYGNYYIYVFSLKDTYYRIIATAYPDIADAIWMLDRNAEDLAEQMNELAANLPVLARENLSDSALSAEDRAKLSGRPGAELLDNGWRCKGYNLQDMIFTMVFGPFEYDVQFDGDAEGFQEEDLKTMIIKEVSAPVLGNATDLGAN